MLTLFLAGLITLNFYLFRKYSEKSKAYDSLYEKYEALHDKSLLQSAWIQYLRSNNHE